MSIGSRLYGAALALSLCLPVAAHGAEVAKQQAPTPLSAYELYRIYGDKTWTWNTGGGRFSDDGRRFVAWSNDKGKPSFAEGRWVVDDLGQLCMRATRRMPRVRPAPAPVSVTARSATQSISGASRTASGTSSAMNRCSRTTNSASSFPWIR